MPATQRAMLLRIYTEEGKRNGGGPLYEHIVMKARQAGLAGATVLRGPMGFGQSSRLHTEKILRLSSAVNRCEPRIFVMAGSNAAAGP